MPLKIRKAPVMNMKIAIIGSREFDDYELLKRKCNYLLQNIQCPTIISGGARGTDQLAERYARENNFPLIIHKPDWNLDGKSAGMKRNISILNDCTHVIAFWNGISPGTEHMIRYSKIYRRLLRIVVIT